MDTYQPWLPAAAIERGTREVPLRQVVDDWSAKWFANGSATLTGDPVIAAADTRNGWELADGLAVLPVHDADRTLATLLFGTRADDAPLTAADEAALQSVGDACVADLRARLTTAFRLPSDAPWRPALAASGMSQRWTWRVEAGRGTVLLRIAVDESLIARRVRSAMPPATHDRALASLAAALVDQPVDVSALVGRCSLTTAELAGLGPGDVVVLDRALNTPVELAVDRDPTKLSCLVAERDGGLTLTLVD